MSVRSELDRLNKEYREAIARLDWSDAEAIAEAIEVMSEDAEHEADLAGNW